jgi:hypothetical protein
LRRYTQLLILVGAGCCLADRHLHGQITDSADASLVRDLVDQNRRLQAQVAAQQKTIDELGARVDALSQSSARQDQAIQGMKDNLGQQAPADGAAAPDPDREVRISGDVGLAFFKSGSDGQFPNGDFRVDEARVFLEAPVLKNTFLVSEMDLVTREAYDDDFQLGDLYADFENLSGLWGQDNLLSVKAGRFDIPFGEEYESRHVMENPLISHSLSDIWGFDQGLELYGRKAPFTYVASVQDGGSDSLHNYSADKSFSGRVGWDPAAWLHLSASAMRTGELNVAGDQYSAVWFGNALFRALGPASVTTQFGANLLEVDAAGRWQGGSLKAAAGTVRFGDNDPQADDSRHADYFYIEAVQRLSEGFFGAARFSQISAPRGFPVVGQGNFGEYDYEESTTRLNRLSMGVGYQFGPPMVLKVEVSPEWGRTTDGDNRDQEDVFSTELGLKF